MTNQNKQQNQQASRSKEVGFVKQAKDYLIFLEGLPTAHVNDIIVSENGARALVSALEKNRIEALMLDEERPRPGVRFYKSKKGLSFPLGKHLLGRAINPLGVPFDDKGHLPEEANELLDLDLVAPGIDKREKIREQMLTGMTLVDVLLPVGKGQRELMLGDPRSGMPTFALNAIKNQTKYGLISVYAAIGKSDVETKRFLKDLKLHGCLHNTVLLAATTSMSVPLISIAVAVSCSIAESFSSKNKEVLLVWDNLGTHAKYLREISLLAGRIPGRESYPADIFYQHSHLIERAGNFNEKVGGGSITLLPIIETELENLTALVPTNVMSATDGHILFNSHLTAQGIYPAVELDRSVTRVGHACQPKIFKVMADKVKALLAEYREVKKFSSFGAELGKETQLTLNRGDIILELLKQEPLTNIEPYVQISMLGFVFTPFLLERGIDYIKKYKTKFIETLRNSKEIKEFAENHQEAEFDEFINGLQNLLSVLEQNMPAADKQEEKAASQQEETPKQPQLEQQIEEQKTDAEQEKKKGILGKIKNIVKRKTDKKDAKAKPKQTETASELKEPNQHPQEETNQTKVKQIQSEKEVQQTKPISQNNSENNSFQNEEINQQIQTQKQLHSENKHGENQQIQPAPSGG